MFVARATDASWRAVLRNVRRVAGSTCSLVPASTNTYSERSTTSRFAAGTIRLDVSGWESLDPVERKCEYLLLPCSFGCGQRVRSSAMKHHKVYECPKRGHTCEYMYCGYHNARVIVRYGNNISQYATKLNSPCRVSK